MRYIVIYIRNVVDNVNSNNIIFSQETKQTKIYKNTKTSIPRIQFTQESHCEDPGAE